MPSLRSFGRLSFVLTALAFFGAARSDIAAATRTEITNAAQPQLYAAGGDRVWLVYGSNDEVLVAQSKDGGATFAPASKVASIPQLMLGMRRGPRIAAHGDRVTVTLIGSELFAFHSTDGGATWSKAVTVNEVPKSAREGLHDLTGGPDGQLFVTWLDLRNGKTELWGASSRDGGRTWAKNEQVYRSPDKTICECCHPSALFDGEGNLAVMWRNSISGSRDLWMTTRAKGAAEFSVAKKVGSGTWVLNACPMDGGRILALGGGKFASVWQRAGEIFYAPPDGNEVLLGKGKQPVATARGSETVVLWQDGTDLVSTKVTGGGKPSPVKRVSEARFPIVVQLADGGALLAYEKSAGAMPVIEHGPGMHTAAKQAEMKAAAKLSNVAVERL